MIVVYPKWNPTSEIFNLDKFTTKLMNEIQEKQYRDWISTPNSFDVLLQDYPQKGVYRSCFIDKKRVNNQK